MTAPLTKSRNNKILLIKKIQAITFNLAFYPKGCLDRIDLRNLKEVTRKLEVMEERVKPSLEHINKNVSIE